MMLRKIGVSIFGSLLIFMLVSCGKGKNNEPQPAAQPAVQTAQPQPAQAPQVQTPTQPAESAKPEAHPAKPEPAKPVTRASKERTQPAAVPERVEPAVQPAANPPVAAAPPATPAKQATEVAPVVPPPPPPPIRIPTGTRFDIRLIDSLNSAVNKAGDTFRSALNQDITLDGKIVLPKGSVVYGKCIEVKGSGRVEGRAAMSITLTKILAGGASYPLQTNTLSFEAEGSVKEDATKVGIGAGVGAIIGAIAGGGKGAAIGAAVGGGAGTAAVLVTKGKEVSFRPEERFSFVLNSDFEIKQ